MKFKIFKATNGNYYWRLVSADNAKIAQSEGYPSKQGAEDGVSLIKQAWNAPTEYMAM